MIYFPFPPFFCCFPPAPDAAPPPFLPPCCACLPDLPVASLSLLLPPLALVLSPPEDTLACFAFKAFNLCFNNNFFYHLNH